MPVRPTRLALALGALALLGRVASARAEPRSVLRGDVREIVAAGDGVIALVDDEVVVLDADGSRLRGCGGAHAAAGGPPRPDGTALSAEEVLGEAGFSDEDESIEAEDVLDDEGIAPTRRRPLVEASAGLPRALALAGTPDGAWIGTTEGLWRLDLRDGACVPVGLGGQALSLVAAAGTTLVAIADETVWRSRDLGVTFEVAAVLTSRAHALALAPDGETALVADEDGVVALDGAPGLRRVLEERVDALASCGAGVVALAEDGVVRLDAAGVPLVLGPRPPVRALACASADGPGLVAAGVGAWSSADGSTWREEPEALGRSFARLARAAGRTWLASDDALVVLEPRAEAAPTAEDVPLRPALEREPPLWAGMLPRVAVAFDGWTESAGVAGWRIWVLVTVSVGRHWQRTVTQNPEEIR